MIYWSSTCVSKSVDMPNLKPMHKLNKGQIFRLSYQSNINFHVKFSLYYSFSFSFKCFSKELYYILLTLKSVRKLLIIGTQCSDQNWSTLDVMLNGLNFNKKLRCLIFKHCKDALFNLFSSIISLTLYEWILVTLFYRLTEVNMFQSKILIF